MGIKILIKPKLDVLYYTVYIHSKGFFKILKLLKLLNIKRFSSKNLVCNCLISLSSILFQIRGTPSLYQKFFLKISKANKCRSFVFFKMSFLVRVYKLVSTAIIISLNSSLVIEK